MPKNSIFILLPDGVGLRNFAYSGFPKIAASEGLKLTYWNNTPFELGASGLEEIRISAANPSPITDLLRRARSLIDLRQNAARTGDRVYFSYLQKMPRKDIKSRSKAWTVSMLSRICDSKSGLVRLRAAIKENERRTDYYRDCYRTLKRERPSMVFCTNQRPLTAIAPILAAQDLGIPTATFLFSWDNVPKATMVIEPDHYLVWSQHMKQELLEYYPYIAADKIHVTGTPQFEPHFDRSLLWTREVFFAKYGLDPNKKYLCYSGDDITTSPNDPAYLADVAAAVRELNASGCDLGIVFRRCPVDFSARFDEVLSLNKDLIVPIAPQWKKLGSVWNTVLPTPEDGILQVNTIAHTEMVINLGSSMVFDFVAHGKPCAFMNYDTAINQRSGWTVKKIYNYVHFRSMPDPKAVIWLNDPKEIAQKISLSLQDSRETVEHAGNWFARINQTPADQASNRIVESLKSILACTLPS